VTSSATLSGDLVDRSKEGDRHPGSTDPPRAVKTGDARHVAGALGLPLRAAFEPLERYREFSTPWTARYLAYSGVSRVRLADMRDDCLPRALQLEGPVQNPATRCDATS
jgi:hypothetical protein